MVFVPSIPSWFNVRKAAQVTAFFAIQAGGTINVLRATKLIYLADRLSLQRREHLITGDDFVSMPFGPVNTFTFNYMNGMPRTGRELWAEFIGKRSDYEIPVRFGIELDDLDELSKGDVKILQDVWQKFKDIEKYELAEWTHKFCPEWRNPHGSSIPIDFATVFNRLNKPDPVELAEDIQAERSLKALLHSK